MTANGDRVLEEFCIINLLYYTCRIPASVCRVNNMLGGGGVRLGVTCTCSSRCMSGFILFVKLQQGGRDKIGVKSGITGKPGRSEISDHII